MSVRSIGCPPLSCRPQASSAGAGTGESMPAAAGADEWMRRNPRDRYDPAALPR
ncbi:hypothetical protein [Burkholderia sp. BCC0405]|uniref:hypothetical protein n=1 Tax=Burkholderia sp. BCC0405 TaxID=2676298 RepID=UPI00158D4BE0|nr:hypothetical protein [Burkholderia sp. BCC0405]